MTITYAHAGDSNSARLNSWRYQIPVGTDITEVGGFSLASKTTGEILTMIAPDIDCDVLTLMLGTNDIKLGVPTATAFANLRAIVAKVNPRSVFLSAIAPCNLTNSAGVNRRDKGITFNRDLFGLALDEGWMYGDPFIQFRTYVGEYKIGTDDGDGIHPDTAAFGLVGAKMAKYIPFAARLPLVD